MIETVITGEKKAVYFVCVSETEGDAGTPFAKTYRKSVVDWPQ